MKYIFLLLFAGLTTFSVHAQNSVNYYEYWFDANYAGRIQQPITSQQTFLLNTIIPTSVLSDGLHTFQLRFQDANGLWSTTVSQFFLKYSGNTSTINGYEYWFDNDYANKVQQTVAGQTILTLNANIPTTSLSNGLHCLYFRSHAGAGTWSTIVSQFFLKGANNSGNPNIITAIRYWFDSTFAVPNQQVINTIGNPCQLSGSISTAGLDSGMHIIRYQLKDTGGLWSSMLIDTFYKQQLPSLLIITTTLPGNTAFTDKTLWEGTTGQAAPPIKICADGSNATKLSFVNNTNLPSGRIHFWMASDPYGDHADSTGYFINYTHSNTVPDTISATLAHPSFMNLPQLYRADSIRIVDTLTGNNAYMMPVQIYRAPVLMVHGLWGSTETFQSFEANLDNSGLYPNILTFSADYVQTNDQSFYENRNVVPNEMNTLFTYCRNHGFSAGKIDLVGHSMGGLLARQYIQSVGYRNDIRKLITVNTPHSGTQAANLLWNSNPYLAGEVISHSKYNVYSGAVFDLRAGLSSGAINNLNTGVNQNFNNYLAIACHAISTIQPIYLPEPTWGSTMVNIFRLDLALTADAALNSLYQNEENDWVVPLSSQQGGLTGLQTSLVNNQWHVSCNNLLVQNEIEALLNAKTSNNIFTFNGFSPPTLTSLYKHSSNSSLNIANKQTGTGTVTITSPQAGAAFNPGQQITISISSTGTINHLTSIESNKIAGIAFADTAIANANFLYTIPPNAVGSINVVAVGADDSGTVNYDTLSLNVAITASLDSLHFYPEEIAIPLHNNFAVNLTGYYQDGIARVLNFVSDVHYEVADTNIAQYAGDNLIYGKQIGTTSLSISYLGDTVQIPVYVFPGDPNFPPTSIQQPTQSAVDVSNPMLVYPNPSKGQFTIQVPTIAGEAVLFQVYNQTGQRILLQRDKSNSSKLNEKIALPNASPGVYYIYAYTSQQRYSGKIVITK